MKTSGIFSADQLKIILPSFFAVSVFIISIFLFLLPRIESIAVSQKKKGIEQLVTSTIQMLEHFNRSYQAGEYPLEEARKQAAAAVRALRYGPDMKDYFWIINTEPRVIAHPYRFDLEGDYVGDYKDEKGRAFFIEMVSLTEQHGEGYVQYLWQLRDEEQIISEKISFVKLYKPWNWIVGTGIYLQELEEEIAGITRSMTVVSIFVVALVSIFLVYIIRQGISIEKAKAHVENRLVMSENKYEFLVEFMKEGIFIQNREGLFTFVNDSFCSMLGYLREEILGQPLAGFVAPADRDFFNKQIEMRRQGEAKSYKLDWVRKSGEIFNSMVSPKPLFSSEGEYDGSFGAVTDITFMQRMLDEKNILLNEVHHRVKNNLQLISSLLNLQKLETSLPSVRRHLTETQNRIQTMAMVHDSLYQSERFDNIDFGAFIQQLALGIRASNAEFCSYNIDMDLPAEPVFIDVSKAIPAGLIVQELLSLPLKGEQTPGQAGKLKLRLAAKESRIVITLLYRGGSIHKILNPETPTAGPDNGSLELELIDVLTEQIGGTLTLLPVPGKTEIHIEFGSSKQ